MSDAGLLLAQIQCLKVEWSGLLGLGHTEGTDFSGPFSLPSSPGKTDGRARARLIPFLRARARANEESLLSPLATLGAGSGHPGLPTQLPGGEGTEQLRLGSSRVNPGCSLQPPCRTDQGFPSEVSLPSSWLA